jgi:hypothetical protein
MPCFGLPNFFYPRYSQTESLRYWLLYKKAATSYVEVAAFLVARLDPWGWA